MILNGRVINPGELRTQIELQTRSVSTETGGFNVPEWETISLVWARWSNAHGSEALAAQLQEVTAPATVLIRYRDDLDETCSVVKGNDRYEILSIDDIQERHEFMELRVQRMKTG